MLLPGLSLQKPTSADSAVLSVRPNIENGKLPETNRSSFRENLDRQIDNQQRIDQRNEDRQVKQSSLRQEQMDRRNDDDLVHARKDHEVRSSDTHHPLEHKRDEKTATEASHASKEKPSEDDELNNPVAVNADDIFMYKPEAERKETEAALISGESASAAEDTTASALIVDMAALSSDDAIHALIDGRGLSDNMSLLWKKGDQSTSAAIINHKSIGGDSIRQDVSALTGLDKSWFDTDFVGDNKNGTVVAKEGVNITSLMMSTNNGESRDGKMQAVDPAVLLSELKGELNLGLGAGDAVSKTLRGFRVGTSALLADTALTAQNLSSQQRELTGKIATAVNALPPALTTGSPLLSDFVNRMSEQVMWLRHQNIHVAELRLHPRDLGSVLVRIDSSGDNTSVNFVAAHHTVRDVLDQNMTKLRELFNDAGLNLVNVNVSSESPSQQERDLSGSGSTSGAPSSLFNQDAGLDEVDTDLRQSAQSIHLIDFFA